MAVSSSNTIITRVVRFTADARSYASAAAMVVRANKNIDRSEAALARNRKARGQPLSSFGTTVMSGGGGGQQSGGGGGGFGLPLISGQSRRGRQSTSLRHEAGAVLHQIPGGGLASTLLGVGAAGQAGFLAAIGAAASSLAILSISAIKTSVDLGTVQGIALHEDLFRLKHETMLLAAEFGNELIPQIRPVVQGLTAFTRKMREWGLLSDNMINAQGRAAQTIEHVSGGLAFQSRQNAAAKRDPSIITGDETFREALIHVASDLFPYGDFYPKSGGGQPISPRQPDAGEHLGQQIESRGDSIAERLNNWLSNIPGFAIGGIVNPSPSGMLARIGEGGQREVIAPLGELERIMNRGGGQSSNINMVDHFREALSQANLIEPPWLRRFERNIGIEIEYPTVVTQTEFDGLSDAQKAERFIFVVGA